MALFSPRRLLQAAKTPAFLVTNPVNIRFITGTSVSTGAVLITAHAIQLFVDARYSEKALSQIHKNVRINTSEQLIQTLTKIRKIGFEGDFVTCAILLKWKKKFKNTKFVQCDWIVEEFRRQKAPHEIAATRKACAITLKVLKAIPAFLKKKHTEQSLALEIEVLSRSLGAESMAFDTIVAFGEHTSRPHHSPTNRKLKKDDIVQIDMGVKVDGYCSDYSRVFFLAKPTAEQAKAYRALKKAKNNAEKALKVGVSNHALDRIARRDRRNVHAFTGSRCRPGNSRRHESLSACAEEETSEG